jgi:putative peptidoglycan lipid II flippase
LIVLAYPISRVFVGEYPGTAALAAVLVAFLVGLAPFSLGFFMQKAFYSLEDTRTPFWITVVQSALYIVGALTIQVAVAPIHRVAALAYLTSATVLISGILYFVILRARIGRFDHGLVTSILRFGIAAILGGLLGWLALTLMGGTGPVAFALQSVAGAVITAAIVGMVILVGFVLTLWAMRTPEFDFLKATVQPVTKRLAGIFKR